MNFNTQLDAWLPALGQLNALQQRALHYLQNTGLPTRRVEHWKYTDVQRLLTARLLSFTDTAFAFAPVQQWLPPQFMQQLNAQPGLQASWQPRVLASTDFRDGIDALHYLLVPEALVIRVTGNQQLQLFPSHDSPHTLFACAVTLELAEHAQLALFEADQSRQSFCFFQLKLRLAANSSCQHAWLGRDNDWHLSQVQVEQQQDSVYRGISLAFGNQLSRRDHQFDLLGSQAQVQLDTLSLNQQQQHHDMRLTANHQAPHTRCDLRHYAVADDQAVSNCNGRIHITSQGHQAEGAFNSKSLLLSTEALINTQPELEIYHDQVRCQHGATTSALDEDQRLYLRARGLDERSANALLLEGFVRQAFDHFANDVLSAPLLTQVLDYLKPNNP
jgi:Fe-S cluster assembly protein SufD